jgi:hypothetical protein
MPGPPLVGPSCAAAFALASGHLPLEALLRKMHSCNASVTVARFVF